MMVGCQLQVQAGAGAIECRKEGGDAAEGRCRYSRPRAIRGWDGAAWRGGTPGLAESRRRLGGALGTGRAATASTRFQAFGRA